MATGSAGMGDGGRVGLRAAGLALCLLASWPTSATAYRQYKTSTGAVMRWPAGLAGAVTYTLDDDGLGGDGIGKAAVRNAVGLALGTWQAVTCPTSCGNRALGIVFEDRGWAAEQPIGIACVERAPAGSCARHAPNGNQVSFVKPGQSWTFSSLAVAYTLVTAVPKTGELVDADIALNDAGYAFCTHACGAGEIDLRAVLTHEAGHFIGLDHSLVPGAMMRAGSDPAMLTRGPLHGDDKAGACASYPGIGWGCPRDVDAGGAGGAIPAGPRGSCEARPGASGAGGGMSVLLGGLLLLAAIRRRAD